MDDSPRDLQFRAAACRRIAEEMGGGARTRALIEMAEEFEERAAAMQADVAPLRRV
ncbi:MAG: hypothetical protein JWO25_2117 [Alphaproteobacteria bacterium]|nr:hypothetical protein [Alphaproteobacteria bacterium]